MVRRWAWVGACAWVASGCISSDGSPAGAAGATDAQADASNETPVTDATIEEAAVEAGPSLRVFVAEKGHDDPVPIANAVVALDTAGGKRVEAQTDSNGYALFEAPDLSGDGATAIAWKTGYGVSAWEGITDLSDVSLLMNVPEAPDHLHISGKAKGMKASTDMLTFFADRKWPLIYQVKGDSWNIYIPPQYPFDGVAIDWVVGDGTPISSRGVSQTILQYTQISAPAFSSAGTFDIDFASTLTQVPFQGSFGAPATGPFKGTSIGYVIVSTTESAGNAGNGFVSHIDVSQDKTSFEYKGAYVVVPNNTPVTTYYWFAKEFWTPPSSNVVRAGNPTDGAVDLNFLPLLEPVAPLVSDEPYPIANAIQWELPADATEALATITVTGFSGLISTYTARRGATQFTLPKLPTGADPAEIFGVEAGAQIALCVEDATKTVAPLCERASQSRTFYLKP